MQISTHKLSCFEVHFVQFLLLHSHQPLILFDPILKKMEASERWNQLIELVNESLQSLINLVDYND